MDEREQRNEEKIGEKNSEIFEISKIASKVLFWGFVLFASFVGWGLGFVIVVRQGK